MVGSFGFASQDSGRRFFWRVWAGLLPALVVLAGLLGGSQPARAEEDPPGRVGRFNYVQGPVSFSPAGSDEWVEARTSRPLTSGDRIWLGRDARAEISIGQAVLRANEESSLKILQLDDDNAQFQLSQGTLALQVRGMDPDDRIEISTPDVAFAADRPGDYRIQVDPANDATEITVRHGQGTAYADDGRHRLDAPSHARFVANGRDRISDELPPRDGFDRWVEARIERAESRQAARYVSRDMVGYEDLDDYGDWREEPDYGRIWVPRITIASWAPYRYGHWAWIAPWGWTWVDDAPWGFAPFHYGRWAHVHGYWAWVPGPVVRRPYYAPALVAFVGSPGGWSLSISSGPAVAWFPLGPWEHYRPVYRSSPTYITRINRTVVVVEREGDHPRRHSPGYYVNRHIPGAATALPARAFVEGRPAQREMLRVSQRELERAPIAGTMPSLAPVQKSLVGQQDRRMTPPPQRDRERPAVATREPRPPAIERDELAQRFAKGGGVVREAGPSLAEQPRRAERKEESRLRIVDLKRPEVGRNGDDGDARRGAPRPERAERPVRPGPAVSDSEPNRGMEREQQREGRNLPRPSREEAAPGPNGVGPRARPEAEDSTPRARESVRPAETRVPEASKAAPLERRLEKERLRENENRVESENRPPVAIPRAAERPPESEVRRERPVPQPDRQDEERRPRDVQREMPQQQRETRPELRPEPRAVEQEMRRERPMPRPERQEEAPRPREVQREMPVQQREARPAPPRPEPRAVVERPRPEAAGVPPQAVERLEQRREQAERKEHKDKEKLERGGRPEER
jgi:uncharacterized protein DUF6600